MKLATFRSGGREKIGLVHSHDSRLFDVAAAADRDGHANSAFASMLQLIDAGPAALDQARTLFDKSGKDESLSENVAATEILAPIPEPRQMRDGMSFPLHILQAPRGQLKLAARAKNDMAELARLDAEPLGELPEVYRKQPIYYITNRFSVRGTDTTVKWPRYSQVMDYELEFGVITKNKGANISAAKAKDHIFGYTIFNDFSARDAQRIEMEGRLGPAKGKSFDGGNVMGPWIVTPDEIGDPYKLKMEVRVNGKMRSQGVSEGMLFSFEEIIAHVTKDETLMPGEFIGSGTVGNGCGLELGWYLEHGDSHRTRSRKNRNPEKQSRAPGRLKHKTPIKTATLFEEAQMARQLIDISVPLQNDVPADPPGGHPTIQYIDHQQGLPRMLQFFDGLKAEDLPDGQGWAVEQVQLSTHNGTHLDAPWHFHPTMNRGERSWTIDEVPLEWCLQPGVKLDFRHFPNGYVATAKDVEDELKRIGHTLSPLEIVVVNTSAGTKYGQQDYVTSGCGMGYEATMYLLERGVRLTGIDGWSWDAPFVYTAKKYAETKDASLIWEGHKAGRHIGYCHIEKLHNLEQLPSTGFTVSCFPVKIERASAGWTRAVAIIDG